MIVDSPKNILSAKSVGLRVIALATGMRSEQELSQYLPDYILDDNRNYISLTTLFQNLQIYKPINTALKTFNDS